MKISYNWLKEYIDFPYSPTELQDILTMLGLEVGKLEEIGGAPNGLKGVVVGEVLSVVKHPNADRLRLCQVSVGEETPLQIVCGAPNVAAGQKVPVATVGTHLFPYGSEDAFKIKKQKVRGEVSQGMICAEDELGIGTDHDGILVLDEHARVGAPAIEAIQTDADYILEIDLTPNRIDGASHYGVARDLGAYMRKKPQLPPVLDPASLSVPNPIPVDIQDQERCKRYTSLYIEGVTVTDSPEWLKKRLQSIGLRPINNIVDISNFVLHELGQPMHAFDADQLQGREIIVRTLDKAETFVTLDGEERKLLPEVDLMICDTQRPLCIAGTMGGINSGVTADTKNVFLECAYFDAGTVRRTSKRLGINSDSSFRYERGADPHMTQTAALRACKLIMEIAGGTVSKMEDVQYSDFPPFEVSLSLKKTIRLIGQDIARGEILDILNSLEIHVEEQPDGDTLHLKVPPYRVDVQRDVDVIEDILRVYGYNRIKIPARLNASLSFKQHEDRFRIKENYANYLSANGFYEALNNSLVSRNLGNEQAVPIVNPLSEDLGIMRQSMLPGMLKTIRHNQNRQEENLALYEFGKTYRLKGDSYAEQQWLALAVSGQRHPTHWQAHSPKVSLQTLSKEVERLQKWFGFSGTVREAEHADFAYGLELICNGAQILQYGKVQDTLTSAYDLRNEVFYMLIDWEKLLDLYFKQTVQFQPIPVFPSIRRDISLLIPSSVAFSQIQALVQKANPKLIQAVDLHDVYQGKGIPQDKKSYLISIEMRDDKKTLEDKTADKVIERVNQSLQKQLQAEIRK